MDKGINDGICYGCLFREDVMKNFLNILKAEDYVLDVHEHYAQYTQMMVSLFRKQKELYGSSLPIQLSINTYLILQII